jgi:hypothetical protein
MSLFSSPKIPDAPKEDPAVTAARQRAQAQADASLTSSIQDNLRSQMNARQQRFGLVPTDRSAMTSIGSGITSSFLKPA